MPSQQEHPDMFASHCQDQSCNEQTPIQSFTNSRLAGQHPTRRYYLDQYHRDLLKINAGRQPQRQRKVENSFEVTDIVQQPKTEQQEASHRMRLVNKARRTSYVVDGVLHTYTIAAPAAATMPARPSNDITPVSDDQPTRLSTIDRSSLEPASTAPLIHQHTQYPTHPSAHSHSSASHPPVSVIPNTAPNKGLPGTRNITEFEPSGADAWGSAIDSRTSWPWYDGLFHDGRALLPQELEASQPTSLESRESQPLPPGVEARRKPVYDRPESLPDAVIHQPIPGRPALLSNGSYLIEYGTAQQPAEQDPGAVAGGLEHPLDRRRNPPVSLDMVEGGTASTVDEQRQTTAPLYELYKEMRTWKFEDVTEAYSKTVNKPSPPSPRHSGGFEWFYGRR